MKQYAKDILYAVKLSLYYFAGSFLIGIIIGLIIHGFSFTEVMLWGCRVSQILSVFGLSLSAVSFMKRDLMRPLNYQEIWETYFHKLNLSHVIFIIATCVLIFSFIIDYLVRPIPAL